MGGQAGLASHAGLAGRPDWFLLVCLGLSGLLVLVWLGSVAAHLNSRHNPKVPLISVPFPITNQYKLIVSPTLSVLVSIPTGCNMPS